VARVIALDPDAPCQLWDGALDAYGYGIKYFDGRTRRAHVYAYREANGPVPDGLEIDHICENKGCVNPAHLEAVTHAENLRRSWARRRARELTCRNGHPWVPQNRNRAGKCRLCANENQQRLRDRTKRLRNRCAPDNVTVTVWLCPGCGTYFASPDAADRWNCPDCQSPGVDVDVPLKVTRDVREHLVLGEVA
jgi:Zn finger protein HypA/HybF involved in hydrogenase expression